MSDRYADREGVRDKIEWEGGILAAIDYGIRTTDMPEGDTELTEAWDKLGTAYHELAPLIDAVAKLLDEPDSARDALDAQTLHDSPGADL